MSSRSHVVRLARWALLALSLWSCRGSGPSQTVSGAAGKRYTVRAEVVTLPTPPGRELVLRHEAIPDFTDRSGVVVGMNSMVMPFPVAKTVSLVGLAPGDRVRLVFTVDWASGTYSIEKLEKLPAATALTFGKVHRATDGTGSDAPEPPAP